jgi:hypothetical protein
MKQKKEERKAIGACDVDLHVGCTFKIMALLSSDFWVWNISARVGNLVRSVVK